jgi:hypothetical protein
MQRDRALSDQLAATILRYLESCPDACDTAEGVCQWWIPQQRYVESTHDVIEALGTLVERGKIETHSGVDGQLLYRAVLPESPASKG